MAKVVTLEELRAHNSKDSLYMLLHEKGLYLFSANHRSSFCPIANLENSLRCNEIP